MTARISAARLDALVAAALFVLAEVQVFISGSLDARRFVLAGTAGVVTASVAVRRRYPAAVGIGVQAGLVACTRLAHLPAGAVTIGWFCALYALAVWTTTRWFVIGTAFFAVSNLAPAIVAHGSLDAVGPFTAGGVVVMLLLRRIVGDRERRLQLAERERELAAREAVVEERARIARELHDVIAHHVSMMVVQAGAERRVLRDDQGSTREILALIERIGRGALTEMRRLVGMLRSDEDDALTPQPGIDDLPELVARMRDAGLPVQLHVDGERRELPVGIELSAYRIVQEGLTNTLKHAGPADATVHIRYGRQTIEIEIADRGVRPAAHVPGGGHGLVGIRERVALYGGDFDAGHRPEGGFAIRVLLPVR